jgi:hypothetical protein
MNAAKILKSAATLIAPAAARRAASHSAREAPNSLHPLVWAIPPSLIIFGYGGVVVMSEGGSLHRIMASFGNTSK